MGQMDALEAVGATGRQANVNVNTTILVKIVPKARYPGSHVHATAQATESASKAIVSATGQRQDMTAVSSAPRGAVVTGCASTGSACAPCISMATTVRSTNLLLNHPLAAGQLL